MRALGLSAVPSSPTLRQCLDTHASDWFELAAQMNHALLASRMNGKPIDFGTLACGYTPIAHPRCQCASMRTVWGLHGAWLR